MAIALKAIEEQAKTETEEPEEDEEDYPEWPFVYACDDEGYLIADGQPMAETDEHMDELMYAKSALRNHYSDRQGEVYVSGNNFVHYKEGDKTKYLSPDGYVVFGVPQKQRDNYKIWKERGKTPAIVFEFTHLTQ